ncbi:hypothetical protein, partial [Kitasatospora putterlickiae]|uniref:hypothetical protein n=1 Tax=Kitasatospora putterlickiae TaxID=221725 RepID=UPI0031E01EFC
MTAGPQDHPPRDLGGSDLGGSDLGAADGDAVARRLAGTVRRLQHAAERMRAEEGNRALADLDTVIAQDPQNA